MTSRSSCFSEAGRSPVNAITARRDPNLAVHGICAKIAGEGAVVRYTPPGLRARRQRPERARPRHVEDHVVAAPGAGEVRPGVVDDGLGAQLAHEPHMRPAAHPRHRGAEVHGQLHRRGTDRPGRPVDQHRLPSLQARLVPQEARRRRVDERGRLDVAHALRFRRHRAVLGQADVLGVGAEARRDRAEHRLAHAEPADRGPGRRHVAGEIAAQHRGPRPQRAEMRRAYQGEPRRARP